MHAFNEMRFHENDFPQKAFPQNDLHKMQEKHDEEKARNPRLLILSVGRIARQQILDISADYLKKNTGV